MTHLVEDRHSGVTCRDVPPAASPSPIIWCHLSWSVDVCAPADKRKNGTDLWIRAYELLLQGALEPSQSLLLAVGPLGAS